MVIDFRKAQLKEADLLSDIAIESKGYWGYPAELLNLWRKDLHIEKEYIEKNTVRTIWRNSEIVGFFAIKEEKEVILDHLWLLPKAIGQGIGSKAFREIEKECSLLEISSFVIVSDPDAEGFYLHQGAIKIGEVESIPQNRMLPKLRYVIQ
ncbi:GNAT family N-acetyltransferase [Rubellicoccus peritrichatus]|uniref:GNAT family N-acetyltransferase n=1 Tax=Rubellicoccus peritrichatus TaxID=3080537 RepID=A0AAQ3QPV6_9BACT|nr:GNAT family N-acetyltransferase [Puniceicoccus sp. CR14]WOO39518.1 GNAT family N-acetyltransferase [Puniceicoccus sp. CR14]